MARNLHDHHGAYTWPDSSLTAASTPPSIYLIGDGGLESGCRESECCRLHMALAKEHRLVTVNLSHTLHLFLQRISISRRLCPLGCFPLSSYYFLNIVHTVSINRGVPRLANSSDQMTACFSCFFLFLFVQSEASFILRDNFSRPPHQPNDLRISLCLKWSSDACLFSRFSPNCIPRANPGVAASKQAHPPCRLS